MPTADELRAQVAAAYYIIETDRYDASVCTAQRYGEPHPANPVERRAVVKHADTLSADIARLLPTPEMHKVFRRELTTFSRPMWRSTSVRLAGSVLEKFPEQVAELKEDLSRIAEQRRDREQQLRKAGG
jgi:hypothetical protein